MEHWTTLLRQAAAAADKAHPDTAFDKAFNALEQCYGIIADAKNKKGESDRTFFAAIKALEARGKITPTQVEQAHHLRQVRNLVTHKYGFDITPTQALRCIEVARGLCMQFAGKTVADVMVRSVVCAKASDLVAEYIQLMRDKGYSQFPVIDTRNICIGTLDEKSVFDAILSSSKPMTMSRQVASVMVKEVLPLIDPSASIIEAKSRMLSEDITAFLILNNDRQVLGILTKFELL